MRRVALVTCREIPEHDPDAVPLLESLRRSGLRAELLAWDDPEQAPGAFDLCVLRSCWNYYQEPDAFLRWIDRAAGASRLANPAAVVRWNHHKRYLTELEEAGVPVVPTLWFERGAEGDQGAAMSRSIREREWADVVVKPAISASSFRTRRFRGEALSEGAAFLADLVRTRDAMVQPYIESVESEGERSLVWLAGRPSHAVKKLPRFHGGEETVSEGRHMTRDEEELARRALRCVEEELLYARVDTVADSSGRLVVSELELLEPSLFLTKYDGALQSFVDAIARWAG